MPIKDKKANERVRDRHRARETTDSQSSLNGQTNRHAYTHTHNTCWHIQVKQISPQRPFDRKVRALVKVRRG